MRLSDPLSVCLFYYSTCLLSSLIFRLVIDNLCYVLSGVSLLRAAWYAPPPYRKQKQKKKQNNNKKKQNNNKKKQTNKPEKTTTNPSKKKKHNEITNTKTKKQTFRSSVAALYTLSLSCNFIFSSHFAHEP